MISAEHRIPSVLRRAVRFPIDSPMAFARLSCWIVVWRGFLCVDTPTMTFAALIGFVAAGLDRRLDEIAELRRERPPRQVMARRPRGG